MKQRKIPAAALQVASLLHFSMMRTAISVRWPLVLSLLAALYVLMIASRSLSIWYHGIGPYMRPTLLHYRGKGGHYVGKNPMTRPTLVPPEPYPPPSSYSGIKRAHDVAMVILLAPYRAPPVFKTLHHVLKHNADVDIILFHTGEWTQARIAEEMEPYPEVVAAAPMLIRIEATDWEMPRAFLPDETVEDGFHGHGYRSMCRFYASRLFPLLSAKGYEWAIRLDDDSKFLGPIHYNLVEEMVRVNATYGLRSMDDEVMQVSHGLAEATRYYIVSEDIQPTFLYEFCSPSNILGLTHRTWDRQIIYNNFFITRVSFWMRPDVLAWQNYIDSTHGIFKFRWGDAPLHTFTLGMFAPRAAVVEFDFGYFHTIGLWREGFVASPFDKVPRRVRVPSEMSIKAF